MKSDLINLEKKALALRNAGRLSEAVELFSTIVKEQPDWEHGAAFYNLACCYEDLGELVLAERCYGDALRYQPKNPIFLGGFASFLYLHGDPQKAFDTHLTLLEIENSNGAKDRVNSIALALNPLGEKIGLSRHAVAAKIKNIAPWFED
jgi:Flp pilus assembly protein TadD